MVKLTIHIELGTQVKKKDEDGGGGLCEPERELLGYWAQYGGREASRDWN